MKFRGIILLPGSILFVAAVFAQNSGSDDLPSAPSAVQQERTRPKPPPPAAPAASAAPRTSTTSAEAGPQTTPPAESPAAKGGAAQANSSSQGKADPNSNPPDDAATTITKTVNEVNVVFTVTDRHGRYVKNLAKADFSVLDDSKPVEQIRSFHSETDLPLQVGLMVDASNSVRDRFKFEQESAIE